MAPIILNVTKAQKAANLAKFREARLAGFGAGVVTGNFTAIVAGFTAKLILDAIFDNKFADFCCECCENDETPDAPEAETPVEE